MKSTQGFILSYSDTQSDLTWRVLFPSTGLYLYLFVSYMSLLFYILCVVPHTLVVGQGFFQVTH